jgi:alkylated DNA repair protein (DNA oxidative demethylase)
MLDLFDAPVVAGATSRSAIVTAAEEGRLIAAIDAESLTPFRFQQWTGKRLTHSFGLKYDFQSGALSRSEPMPSWLLDIRDRVAAFAGLSPSEIVQALLIRYDIGAGIGWHRDRPIYEHVMGLSLGAPATMRLRKRDRDRWLRASLPLEPRGAYHLSGEARHVWEHSIAAQDRPRHSITFRTLSQSGRRILAAIGD